MNTSAVKTTRKNRKSGRTRRVAGQPVSKSGYDPDRYFYLLVDRTPEMKRALNKIASRHESQKEAVQTAILELAG